MTKRPTEKMESQIHFDEDEVATDDEVIDLLCVVADMGDFDKPEYRPWLKMCMKVDQTRDFAPLLDLMQSAPLSKEMRPFIRDLFERHGLIKGVRKDLRRTPLYKLTTSEFRLKAACEEVEMYVKGYGTNFDVAIQESAEYWKIDAKTLENAYMGRHNPARKMKQRLKKRHLQT